MKNLLHLDEDQLLIDYNNNLLSIDELAIKYNISSSTLYRRLKKFKVKRHNILDNSFFSNIDSATKAQILGFIYADGCMINGSVRLHINDKDIEYLNNINRALKSKKLIYKVNERITKFPSGKYYTTKPSVILDIHNKQIYNDCLRLGLVPNKSSKNLDIPIIVNEFINSFILGLFEGDGCISVRKRNNSFILLGSEKMINSIYNILYIELKIESFITEVPNTKFLKKLSIFKTQDLKILFNWLYKDCVFNMERKYNKWIEIISGTNE